MTRSRHVAGKLILRAGCRCPQAHGCSAVIVSSPIRGTRVRADLLHIFRGDEQLLSGDDKILGSRLPAFLFRPFKQLKRSSAQLFWLHVWHSSSII
jgi:hypothetical protein